MVESAIARLSASSHSDAAVHSPAGPVVIALYAVLSIFLILAGNKDYPALHTVLDTTAFLLAGINAWFCWDIGTRLENILLRWLAATFAVLTVLNLMHALVTVEWSGFLASIADLQDILRPATWPPAAYLLPLGIIWGIFLLLRRVRRLAPSAVGLVCLAAVLLYCFYLLPRYQAPTWLGITRPTLVLVPVLWIVAGWACWRFHAEDRILRSMVVVAAVFVSAHLAMLYSRAPHDTAAMIAHLGKLAGQLTFFLMLVRMAATDMEERLRAEQDLVRLSRQLDARVRERTAELEGANRKIVAQVERLNLLHQITRAIAERQDLHSIFQVALRHVEDSLPIDFGCVGLYDPNAGILKVICVGVKSEAFAMELAMTEHSAIVIDENGLSRCVRGQLVYEPDVAEVPFPFPQRLASGGLRALVAAPLQVESQVFGVLVAARREPHSFSSGDCEILRQLSEHSALASHQAQLHGALQQAYDDLHQTQQAVMQQERLRALGQMASGIAHDINNAISPVGLYTESLLGTEPGLSPKARNYLETIQNAVEDVAETVARMREFYRQKEPELSLSTVDANRVVRQVVDLTRARWSDMAQQRGTVIDLVLELDPGNPVMMGIESEIREALINLVFNAVDAMPDGGTLTMRTSVVRPPDDGAPPFLMIGVADTGIGMDEETRRHCLEPFFTTKGERGTGLGLAMVYGMLQRHGADIEIESTVSRGTSMRLNFSMPVTAEAGPAPAPSEKITLHRLRILVVDDDPLLLKSLRDTLEGDGHIVTAVNGGQAGIDTFQAKLAAGESFALVITDLGMPYVDGRQVARAIKMAAPAMPIILLTGWGQRLVAEGDIPPHVDRVLNKPPKLRELRRTFVELTQSPVQQ